MSILASTLYKLYTSDIPHSNKTTLATYAHDSGVIATNDGLFSASHMPQTPLNNLQN